MELSTLNDFRWRPSAEIPSSALLQVQPLSDSSDHLSFFTLRAMRTFGRTPRPWSYRRPRPIHPFGLAIRLNHRYDRPLSSMTGWKRGGNCVPANDPRSSGAKKGTVGAHAIGAALSASSVGGRKRSLGCVGVPRRAAIHDAPLRGRRPRGRDYSVEQLENFPSRLPSTVQVVWLCASRYRRRS